MRRRRLGAAVATAAVAALAASAGTAYATFPYGSPATNGGKDYRLPDSDPRPDDLGTGPFGDPFFSGDPEWKFAATPGPDNLAYSADPRELNGVRGAHIVDRNTTSNPDTAWETTTGRPEVTLAVLDSGIRWHDAGLMQDVRRKIRLNKGELPKPRTGRGVGGAPGPVEDGVNCANYTNEPANYDANGDGLFNVLDYACDLRVEQDPAKRDAPPAGVDHPKQAKGSGPANVLDPQDIIIAFTDGDDDDSNGYADDIAGWDFLDDDNDPYDDVDYGHGSGEIGDSTAEANNGRELGSCPNCSSIPLRVGDSFVADANRFGQAVTYAVDNDVLVVQEALGTLNNSPLATQAIDYAYNHGVTVIASAADEAAQHNNWPSSNQHVVLVNSVTKYANQSDAPVPGAAPSYLSFNGCTNFNAKITLAIPSGSCSSEATGRGAGMAGLVYSQALNMKDAGKLGNHPTCKRADGSACLLSANEVRQLMASGTVDGKQEADDVNFAAGQEPSCSQGAPNCTDPFFSAPTTNARAPGAPASLSYPARGGHDQFYGYGRVNMNTTVKTLSGNTPLVPPEAEIESPDWYSFVDPAKSSLDIRGEVGARNRNYTCRVYVAPGSYPNNAATPTGDFKLVGGAGQCNGSQRNGGFNGVLGTLDLNDLKSRFPAGTNFNGPLPQASIATHNGRPNPDPFGFVVKVVTTTSDSGKTLTGEDRRNLRLHRDQDMLAGFPRDLGGDGASSPAFADLDGDNRNEAIVAGSDGFVHAFERDGSELPGWPVRGDKLPLHTGSHAFKSGAVSDNFGGAMLGSVAVGDFNRDGALEVFVNDLEGKVYGWDAQGNRVFTQESDIKFSGKPLQPFVNVRKGHRFRTQHGFIGSVVLADLDRNDDGRLEIIAAGMDRHVYAWNDDGSRVPGFPVLVVDRNKIDSVDPQTHAPVFNANAGSNLNQGAIVDTPAVGDITGDAHPEIVVGTNEEYEQNTGNEGLINSASAPTGFTFQFLGTALGGGNSRLYAIKSDGDKDGDPKTDDFKVSSGWPVKIGYLQSEVLPVVGEGITGYPIIGTLDCGSGKGPKVGVIPDAGGGYLLNPDGTSCLGQEAGRDRTLQFAGGSGDSQYDNPVVPGLGHPGFGLLDASGPSFLSPSVGLNRAGDIALPEYQNGQDFVGAWTPAPTGEIRPRFPVPVNDLQFLTGPSVAELDGDDSDGQEIVSGTASLDLAAINSQGGRINNRWPKLTSDWVVANPLIGSWGTLDSDSDARKVVFEITRAGFMLAYKTDAKPCSPSSWPRFHHDNANSGDFGSDGAGTDVVPPGKPLDASLEGSQLTFKAPGDNLMCGKVDHYEVIASDQHISSRSFRSEQSLPNAPAPDDPGKTQTMGVPTGAQSIAIRAVDKKGNVGRYAIANRKAGAGGGAGGGQGGTVGGRRGANCLSRRARATSRRIGPIRVGATKKSVLRRAGAPRVRHRRAWRYCVRGGGRVLVAFSRRGRVRLVATTARRHGHGRLRTGTRIGRLHVRRIGRSLYLGTRRSKRDVFRVRRGRVRVLAVVDRGLARNRRALRGYLRLVSI